MNEKAGRELTLSRRAELLQSGELDLAGLAEDGLKQAQDKSDLNAFITLLPERARQDVERVKRSLKNGQAGPLAGTVLAVKDNIALEGEPLTCASRILDGYISPYTATALQRLIDAGVVIIGKANMDEFAMGSSNENSAYGPVRNPHDPERVPGGSSGGSAAAVAAGIVTAALGSDTGGSVRQPAALCGVIGLKPTYGRVSRYGLVAFGSSLDQIGVLAGSCDETARVFQVMAGEDPLDNTTSPTPVPDCVATLNRGARGLKIGIPEEYGGEGLHPVIERAISEVAELLTDRGAEVKPCSLPHTEWTIPTYYIISSAECSSNLARYDGVRYGLRLQADDSVAKTFLSATQNGGQECPPHQSTITPGDTVRQTRQSGFGPEVRRRIMLGTYVLSSGYYDAYYLKAQKARRLIREDFVNVFREFDLLLTPTAPTTAFRLGEKIDDPLSMYLSDVFTASANLAGIPTISCPWGKDDSGLPIGVQLMADDFREDLLLAVAAVIEAAR